MTMRTGLLRTAGAVAAAGLLVLFTLDADAQDKKAAARKAPSACQGLAEAACKAKADQCTWIAATKTKVGKARRAHCRSRPPKKK